MFTNVRVPPKVFSQKGCRETKKVEKHCFKVCPEGLEKHPRWSTDEKMLTTFTKPSITRAKVRRVKIQFIAKISPIKPFIGLVNR